MIILDISKVEETVDAGLVYVQNDSVHVLEMTIQDNGAAVDLTGKTAKIRFCTRGGYVNDEPCTIVSAAAGTLSYKMLGAQLVRGEVLGIVSLYVGGERQSTSKFRLLCVDDLSSDESVKDSVQYSELQKALAAAEAATGAADEAAGYAQSQGDYAKEKGDAVSLEWEPHVADEVIHITAEERAGWNNKVDKAEGKGLSTNDYTTAEKEKLAGVQEGAEVNQNAFGVVSVDGVFDINATSKTDKLNIVGGSNITLNNYDDYGYQAVHISAKDTTYENATETKAGLMSSADKAKLNGIETGAEKNVVKSVSGKTGVVVLDKSDVGLGNLTNDKQAKETDFNAHDGDNVRHITAQERSGWNGKVSQTELSDGLALKADKADFDAHNADGERHITAAERARWDASAIVGDASGDKIVLDDVAPQGAIRELEIYGKSEQDGEPTPETPIDIVNAENFNALFLRGRNLLDTTGIDRTYNGITCARQNDGGVKVTGTSTGFATSTQIDITPRLKKGKTYAKSWTGGVTGLSFVVALKLKDGAVQYPTTFTFDDTVDTVKAYLQIGSAGVTVDKTVYLQVEEGSAATAYEPYGGMVVNIPYELRGVPNTTGGWLARDYIEVKYGAVKLVRCVDATIDNSTTVTIVGNTDYILAAPTIEDITETETGQALLVLTLTAPTASVSNTAESGMAVRYEVDGTIAYKKLASAIVALGGTI